MATGMRFFRAMADLPHMSFDTNGLQAAYGLSILAGNLDAADRALADPRMKSVPNSDGTIGDPVALHRAFVSYLRGKPDEARQFANAAIEAYHRPEMVAAAGGMGEDGHRQGGGLRRAG